MKKVFVVEDHPSIRSAYRHILDREKDLELSGEAGTAEEGLALISEAQQQDNEPDIMVLDLSLPGMSGAALLQILKELYPALPVLIVSGHDELLYAQLTLEAGAEGYLDKLDVSQKFVEAIRLVLHGEKYISPHLAEIYQIPLDRRAMRK